MKRFLASLLAVLMLVSLLPMSAFAAQTKAAATADAQEPAQIVAQQLVLGDNLNMRFWVKANMENAVINVTIGNGAAKSIALTEKDANGNYIVNVALAAAQMTDAIVLQAEADGVTGTAKQYTVRQYAEKILEGKYSQQTIDLVLSMLNYGAAAQVYFNYNNTPDQLANKGYENNPSVSLPQEQEVVIEGAVKDVQFYGASLSFRDRIALRYYFTGDISGLTIDTGAKPYTLGEKDDRYYVELADINPQDYSKVYTVSVSDGENTLSVGYSTMHYISRMSSRGNAELQPLLKSLYTYHNAAVAYNEWIANCENLTEYIVVYGDEATNNEIIARDMIVEYIRKSTGVQLPIIPASEASYTADAKYLVVGNTGLANMAPVADLGYRGYQIQSKDNSVFVYGATDFGTLCGAVGFLEAVVGLDAYGPHTVNYDKKSEILFDGFDLTVVPDIGMEQPPFMLVSGSMWNQALWGVGQKAFGLIEGSSNHWHNSFDYLPPVENFLTNRDFYVWSGIEPVQLSYVANGNAKAFEEMTTICADKIIAAATKDPSMERITLTAEDNTSWDTCDAAMALYNKYGTHSAEVIIFMNAVADKVKNALPERDLDIYFFAYVNTYKAPVKEVDGKYVAIDSEVEMRDNLGVMYAPINGDYTAKDFTTTTMYQQLSGWAALTDNIAVWSYETNFDNYFNFYNSFNILPSMYQAEAEMGVDYSYSQGQWNNGNATGFSHLKTYLIGKLSWNADADFEALLDNYFAARFGSAAADMRALFDGMRAYYDKLQDTYEEIDGSISQSAEYLRTDRFEKAEIEKWLGYLDAAYAKADNDTIRNYIDLESLAVRYLMVELYGDTMAISDLMVMIHTFREDCEALNITKFSESKDIDYLWKQWDDSTVTEIEGVSYNFDLSLGLSSYEMTIPASIGAVMGVYGSGYNKLEAGVTIGADTITFTQEAVNNMLGGDSYGDYVLYLSTADTIYKVTVSVVTKMIDSYDDLVSIKANQANGVLDGYYALANDIDATGEDAICLIEFAGHINNLENSGIGFKGIFDGRGYTISNLTVKAGEYAKVGGLFGQILKGAIVRNVAFMDMTTDGATTHTYLLTGESCRMIGTIENVVVSAKGTVSRAFGFVGCDVSKTADAARGTMRNVIISGVEQLAYQIMNMPTIENVIVVANKNLIEAQSSNVEDQEICKNLPWYNSNEVLFAALNEDNVIAQWTDSEIAYENTAIKFNGKAIITEQMSVAETEAVIGTATELTVQGNVNLSLKDAADGVTLSGKTLTVASSVKEGTKITVVATSTVSGAVKEFVITLRRVYTDAALGRLDAEIGSDVASMAAENLSGNAECLRYGNTTVYEGYTLTDGVLTVSKDLLDAMYGRLGIGEHTIYLGTDASYRYAITLTFATKIINTVEDFESISTTEATLDGYYILNADLDCTGKTIALLAGNQTAFNVPDVGFKGTFDGRGHTISNLTTCNGSYHSLGGVFGQLCKGAVVKNVAFVNLYSSNENNKYLLTGDGTTLYGTLENVAVVGTDSRAFVMSKLDNQSGKIENCFFVNVNQISTESGLAVVNKVLSVTANAQKNYGGFAWSGNATYNAQPNYATINDMFYALMGENVLEGWENSLLSYEDGQIFFNGKLIVNYNLLLQGESTIYRGTEQTYVSDGDVWVEPEIDGVDLQITGTDENGNDIYTLIVDSTVPAGTQIVLIAYSFDFEAVTKELVVTVEKLYTDVDLTGEGNKADIQVTGGATIEFGETVEAIAYGNSGMVTEGIHYADGKLSLTKEAVAAIAAEVGLGEKTLKLFTADSDKCYAITVTLATKLISSLDDLKSIATDNATLDGYYVLTQDIVCDETHFHLPGASGYFEGQGFVGTFDGRGHTIDGYNGGEYGLFWGTRGTAVIKNVAFTNMTGTYALAKHETHTATFENVYVSGSVKYFTGNSYDATKYHNVIFVSDNADAALFVDGNNNGNKGTMVLNNVFVVGAKVHGYYGGVADEVNVNCYANVDALLAALRAEGAMDKWAGSPFTYTEGKLFFNEKLVCQAPVSLVGADVIIRGTSEVYTSNGTISIKNPIDGVSVNDGVLSVAYTVPVDTIITLVATHPVYTSISTELQIQVGMIYEEIDLTNLGIVGDLETVDSYSFIKLPEEIHGDITGISYGEEQKYTGVSVSDGELAIPKAWVAEIYGACGYSEQDIKLYTNTDKCYTVKMAIVTKAIANLAELKSITSTTNTLDGYYVLTQDIGCGGETFKLVGTWSGSLTTGFIGTFDGRGHTISNYNGGTTGLFYCLGAKAVIKNVAFTNTSGTVALGGSEIHGATFENVFVGGSVQYFTKNGYDAPKYKNVVFMSSHADAMLFYQGNNNNNNGTMTLTNVFVVGTKLHDYYGGTMSEVNAIAFADSNALLAALGAEGEMDKWANSSFSIVDGKLLFGGKPLSFTEAALSNPVNLGDIQIAAAETVMDVPAEITGNIIGVSSSNTGRMSDGVEYANGKLTLSRKTVENLAAGGYGETSLKIYTDEGKVYSVAACVVTKAISNLDDLKSIAIGTNTLDGYYVLTDDIDCNGESFKLVGTWSGSMTTGFIGTFDGRGHTISNYNGGTTGLFYCLGAKAVIKNVAFTNTSGTVTLAGTETHGTTFENVFVSGSVKYFTNGLWDKAVLKNVIFASSDPSAAITTTGSNSVITMTNVFVVGAKLYNFLNTTPALTNTNVFADTGALLAALRAEGEMDKWSNSSFSIVDGKLLFNGKVVVE